MKILRVVLIVACASFHGEAAFAEDIVARMVGVWVGQGVVRPRGFDAPEKIRCKVIGKKLSDVEVRFSGRCATTSGAGAFRLFIAQDETGSLFAARVRFSGAKSALEFNGDISADKITLLQDNAVAQGDRLVLATLSLLIPKDGDIEMINDIVDLNSGEIAQSLNIKFVRRK